MFFAVLASYYVLRPVRDAFVLDGDPNFVVWLFTATFVLMLAIAPPWGAAVARWPRDKLVPLAYRAMIAQLVLFAAVISAGAPTTIVSKVFYVWVSMYNLFVVSVFWSLCADIARPEQGRRLFGMIAAGGTIGALTGPALTKFLAEHVGIETLLLISAAFLELAVWISRGLARADRALQARRAAEAAQAAANAESAGSGASAASGEPAAGAPLPIAQALPATAAAPAATAATASSADRAIGGSPFAGLTRVVRSPYLSGIGLYMIFTATLATFVYFSQLPIVKEALPDRVSRTVFYAEIELWSSLITLIVQLLVTARVLRWLGVGVVLALLPLAQSTGAIWLATAPTLAVVAVVSPVGRALTHSLARPSRELLFTAVVREDKFKSKNVIDTFAYRLGDFASAWLHRGLLAAGIASAFAIVPIAIAWVTLSIALGIGYRRRTSVERSS